MERQQARRRQRSAAAPRGISAARPTLNSCNSAASDAGEPSSGTPRKKKCPAPSQLHSLPKMLSVWKGRPGYPCRVSLADAQAGDELLLLNYEHHAVASPYRMRFAIYVRAGDETYDAVNQIPDQLQLRTLAARGYESVGLIGTAQMHYDFVDYLKSTLVKVRFSDATDLVVEGVVDGHVSVQLNS